MAPKKNSPGQGGHGPPLGIYHHKFTLANIARHHVLVKDLSMNSKSYADPGRTGIRCYYSLPRDVAQQERSKRNPDYVAIKSKLQLLMAPMGTNVSAATSLRRIGVILQKVVPPSLENVLDFKGCVDTGGPFMFNVATPILGDNLWNYFQNLRKLGNGQPPFAFIWHVAIKLLELLGTLRWGDKFNNVDSQNAEEPEANEKGSSMISEENREAKVCTEIPEPSYPLLLTNLSFSNIIAVRFPNRPALVPRLSVVDFTRALPHPSFSHKLWGSTYTELLLRKRDWDISENKDWFAVGSIMHTMLHTKTDPSCTVPDELAVDKEGYCTCGNRIVYQNEASERPTEHNEERRVLRMISWLCSTSQEKISPSDVKDAINYATEKRLAVIKTESEAWANVTQSEMSGFVEDGIRVSNAEVSKGLRWKNPKWRD